MINAYHKELLLEWKGNMDIQYIGEISKTLHLYITGYISKSERNAPEQLWQDCNRFTSINSKLKSCCLQMFKAREAGIYEVTDKLLGYHMYDFSSKVQYLDAKPNRLRTLIPHSKLVKLEDTVNPHSVTQWQGIFSEVDYYFLKARFKNFKEYIYSE